jgi:predicted P-loop ATPase/GTPase
MVKNILVIGLTQQHAGKTSLAAALLSYFTKEGYVTSGFKPFSGYNYWYHFDMAHHSLSEGRLYSKDIVQLHEQSTVKADIELFNPIHRLWNEPAIYDNLTTIPPFLMDRFSMYEKETLSHHLLINNQLISQLPEEYKQKLDKKKYTIHPIETIQSMNTLIQSYYNQAIESCYEKLKTQCDLIVIESYADNALLPWNNMHGFDVVLGIKPWMIHKYDPEKYVKAVQLSKPVSAWETSTEKLSDLLKPIERFDQKPALSTKIIEQLTKQVPTMLNDL